MVVSPDPAHPNAMLLAAPLMTLDESLSLLSRPAVTCWCIPRRRKVEEPLTASAEASAQAILERWVDADLPNPWLISTNQAETLRTFRAVGGQLGVDVFSQLIVPFHPTGGSETKTALNYVIPDLLGTRELVAMAREAEADLRRDSS